ncbi:flagellin [Phenylobacterium terrae]|uniref:Flagellin n=1 Tax=Phenylobacterium terrae TaxID=2665495 RepID=A0ABW4MX21_9CAUL
MLSVNTNVWAMSALATLNAINRELAVVQQRITTGLRVASAKDDPSTWAIAQMQRSELGGLKQVSLSIQRGQAVVDVAMMAGENISDLVLQMKDKAVAAMDFPAGSTERAAVNEEYLSLRRRIDQIANTSDFNGINLISAGGSDSVQALADTKGGRISVAHVDLSTTGSALSGLPTDLTGTVDSTTIEALSTGLSNVNSALGRLGTGHKALQTHLEYVGKLQDTMEASIGRLVDADLAKESARWQALQVRQQLAIMALSMANRQPSIILQLFQQR